MGGRDEPAMETSEDDSERQLREAAAYARSLDASVPVLTDLVSEDLYSALLASTPSADRIFVGTDRDNDEATPAPG